MGPVNKGPEYAVFVWVGLLLVIVVPHFFDKGEFGYRKFAGGWGLEKKFFQNWNSSKCVGVPRCKQRGKIHTYAGLFCRLYSSWFILA